MIIINLFIDESRLCYKITINIEKTYRILNYTTTKPRSRTPQKKSAYFTQFDFSAAKIEKKVRKLREQIRYIMVIRHTHSKLYGLMSRNIVSLIFITGRKSYLKEKKIN